MGLRPSSFKGVHCPGSTPIPWLQLDKFIASCGLSFLLYNGQVE